MNFRSFNELPFIYDTYQLSEFIDIPRSKMFSMIKTDCRDEYRTINIKKKNGQSRTLNVPSYILKYVQKRILLEIATKLPVSKYATAYKTGAKLEYNALPHTNKKYILKMDITNFFGSICFEQIYSAAFNTRYFPKHIGVMLTTLCCYNDVLPQGAPTSPALSNLVLKNFDENIGKWCEKRGISYTRYCDDMTFSSNKNLYNVYAKVKDMLQNIGFEINERKTRFITKNARQTVTGLTVNEKVSISKDYKRDLRKELYYIFKFGPENSLLYTGKGEYIKDGQLNVLKYLNILEGKLNFLLSIEKNNLYFKEALVKIKNLKPKYI